MNLERLLQDVLHRQAVTDLVHEYCRLFDENQPERVAELFTKDATVDYGPESETIVGRDNIGRTIAGGLTHTFAATSHHVSNVQVVFEGERGARSTSYLYAWHRYVDGSPDGELWGRYRHRFLSTPGAGWRISELRLEVAGTVDFHRRAMHPIGRRSGRVSTGQVLSRSRNELPNA